MLNIKSLLLLANCLKDNSNFEMPLSVFFISILSEIYFHDKFSEYYTFTISLVTNYNLLFIFVYTFQ